MNIETGSRRRPQDDLPYEQRMKHIIEHYRWLLEQNDRLAAYARSLEQKIEAQGDRLAKAQVSRDAYYEKLVEKRRECRRLSAHIEWLKEKLRECEEGGAEQPHR